MAVQQGYGKIAGADALVFAYDTGDTRNSYKGEPTTNLYGDINTSSGIRPARTEYTTDNWTASFPAPPEKIGRVYKHESGALNSTWSGNSYGYTLKGYTYSANITYTLSCWVYVSPDCNITALHNSMEGTTLTDTTNRYYDLNNKGTWQQIVLKCNSSTSISGNVIPVYPSRSGVTDGSFSGFYAWGGAKLEAIDHVTPYTVGTRSATQGLLDLTGNETISLTNTSFDANAQPAFDGTEEYFDLGSDQVFKTSGGWTVENIVRYDSVAGGYDNYISPANFIGSDSISYNSWYWSVLNNKLALWNISPGIWKYGSTIIQPNTWYHVVLVSYDSGTQYQMYLNGVAEGGDHTTYSWNATYSGLRVRYIGAGQSTRRFVNGEIPVTKIYNRALTATEVAQNFNHYKTRYNL